MQTATVARWAGFAAILVSIGGCASSGGRPAPPLTMPLGDALARLGAVETSPGQAETPEVVILKDRHAVGPGIFHVDEELRALQRDHHALVTHLVARGFNVLGCEHALGPLPDNAAAADHRAVIDETRATGDDLNRWSVYQPLRYAVEFRGRLEVLGVEDPVLYQEDLDTLTQIEKTMEVRRNVGERRAAAFAAEEARLLRKIRDNVNARGSAAAKNLLDVMQQRGTQKAILMLGASHVPAAAATLADAGIRHHVFEAPTFKRKAGN
jgi:hypothetical protein